MRPSGRDLDPSRLYRFGSGDRASGHPSALQPPSPTRRRAPYDSIRTWHEDRCHTDRQEPLPPRRQPARDRQHLAPPRPGIGPSAGTGAPPLGDAPQSPTLASPPMRHCDRSGRAFPDSSGEDPGRTSLEPGPRDRHPAGAGPTAAPSRTPSLGCPPAAVRAFASVWAHQRHLRHRSPGHVHRRDRQTRRHRLDYDGLQHGHRDGDHTLTRTRGAGARSYRRYPRRSPAVNNRAA
jgi:hypothetical protein